MIVVPGLQGHRSGCDRRPGWFPWLFPCAGFFLAVALGLRDARFVPDASWYVLLALGRHREVLHPFSARVLAPWSAAGLARIFGCNVDTGFLLLGILCLLVFLASVFRLVLPHREFSGREACALSAAVFLMPYWAEQFHNYYLPDLCSAAILALLIVSLVRGRMALAMLLLFPAYLARESTSLVVVCLAFALWRRVSWKIAGLGLVSALAGLAASTHFDALGMTSRHGAGVAYLLGKVLWNFPRNTIGLTLWTSTEALCSQPASIFSLPHWLHIGTVRQVGYCGFSAWGPSFLALSWLGLFGVGPAVAIALALSRAKGSSSGQRAPTAAARQGAAIAMRFSVIYGSLSILLAPALGASIDRLVAYGWPLYFLAVPWALERQGFALVRRRGGPILAMHLACCWLAWFVFRNRHGWDGETAIAAGIALALNVAVFFMLDRGRVSTPPLERQTLVSADH